MTQRLSEPHFNIIIFNGEPSSWTLESIFVRSMMNEIYIHQILKSCDKTKCLKSAKLEFSNFPPKGHVYSTIMSRYLSFLSSHQNILPILTTRTGAYLTFKMEFTLI